MYKTLHSPENKKLISWLKSQREGQGLSMRELADKLGVPHSFVGKIEQGERRLDVVEFLQYCKVLGISPLEGLKVIDSEIS